MDLIQAQIAEIKNLNLIYIFTTDNILKDNSNKYVGAKVLYDKDKTFSLDYTSEHFGEFLKRILNRYNKEKDKSNIILLGDLTKKLVKESFFTIIEEEKSFGQTFGILINTRKLIVKGYEKYLERVLKNILKTVKGYNCVTIDSIDGFNYKYVINYSIGNIKKQLFMLIFVKDDGCLDFKITNIEGQCVNISGTVIDSLTTVEIDWYDDKEKLKGIIVYDTKENIIEEKLYKENNPIISRESTDTLLTDDENIISFYMNLCKLDKLEDVMKVDDNCYLLSQDSILSEDTDGIFYTSSNCKINIFDNEVIIKYRQKNGISKYNDQIKVTLEDNLQEFILKKINIEDNFYILIENKKKNKENIFYSYNVLNLSHDVDISKPFDIESINEITEEIQTFDMIKKHIKENKRRGSK